MIWKSETFFEEIKCKMEHMLLKGAYAFKGYASSYNVEILTSFNPEVHLKDIESAIKNKLKKYWLNYTTIMSNIQKYLWKGLLIQS